MKEPRDEGKPERPIFGPATLLFVGRSPLQGCSLLTRGLPKPCDFVSQRNDVPLRGKQCGRPKSLAAPSAAIYEMPSMTSDL